MDVLSPAKINLLLRILGKRNDGYHLLQTYFQLLNWGDEMHFSVPEKDSITIQGNFNELKTQDNLIYKAVQLLLPYRKVNSGIKITVNKKIPHGSGLGGGSSNAGTTLRTLNHLWGCNLSEKHMINLAVSLGADVPLFILNQSAVATGIGEILTPLAISKYYFVLIFPPVSISTVDVFSHENLNCKQKPIEITRINNPKFWTNACLDVVIKSYPRVQEIYQQASQLAPVYMTGTGSTLFSCFKSNDLAQEFLQNCPKHWQTQLTYSA